MEKQIYLDNNATTPLDPRVLDEMLPFFKEKFGNAASKSHAFGWVASEAVDFARERISQLIGATPKEIIFTSGATESCNLAIKGAFENYSNTKGNHLITCVTEHKAVLDTATKIEKLGGEVTFLPVKKDGIIDLKLLEKSINPKTFMICIMLANNETGVIQPIEEISRIAKKHNILLMCDATQGVGKIAIDVEKMGIDLMPFSGHKIYGPKGVGALYVRSENPKVKLISQIDGGGHEKGMRSGTLNVPGIVGLGAACSICEKEMNQETEKLKSWRDYLEKEILTIENSYVNGNQQYRLPHTLNVSFEGVDGIKMLLALKDLAVSSGSACTSAITKPSYVLKAMGLSDDLAYASLRFGLGRFNEKNEIDYSIKRVKEVVKKLRG